jgi:hypothetical protein
VALWGFRHNVTLFVSATPGNFLNYIHMALTNKSEVFTIDEAAAEIGCTPSDILSQLKNIQADGYQSNGEEFTFDYTAVMELKLLINADYRKAAVERLK